MSGGTWTTQNKIRPGSYVNTESEESPVGSVSDRGTVTMPLLLSWGPSQQVITLQAGENLFEKLGYDITAPQVLLVKESLKRARTLQLYRLNTGTKASGTAGGLTATAQHGGARGNDLTVVVEVNIDDITLFNVKTLLSGQTVHEQTGKVVEDLKPNLFTAFSGTGPLEATAGLPLTGGTDGTVTGQDHSKYLEAIELFDFDTMALPFDDATLKPIYASFAKRLEDQQGRYVQVVIPNYPQADHWSAISVKNGVVLTDGTVIDAVKATAWVAGATAGAQVNQALTRTVYDDAVEVYGRLNDTQIKEALTNGEFLFEFSNGKVVVEQDINTYTSFTPKKKKHYSKNRVVRTINGLAKDVKRVYDDFYLGKVDNDDDGRNLYKKDCIKTAESYQSLRAIQSFNPQTDIVVLPGEESDSVYAELRPWPVDAMEKLYMKVKVR